MILRKILKNSIIVASIIIIPTTTLMSCSSYDTNYITSAFYNSYDMLTALGIAPKTQAYANSSLNKKYWDYMSQYIEPNKTNFAIFGQGSSIPNLSQLRSFETYTLVLNEWARPDEYKYIGPNNSGAKHVAYTSMGDSKDSKYYNETSKGKDQNIDWHDYVEGFFSYRAATKMLANDLDKYFYSNPSKAGNQIFNSYSERADYIFLKDIERINKIREQVEKSNLKGKSIGIFSGQSGGGSYEVAESLTAIYEPFLYPQLYGPKDIGFGLKFPKPNDLASDKTLKWADPGNLASVTAKDTSILKQAFQNKFDYIIYVASPGSTEDSIKEQFNKFNIGSYFTNANNSNGNKETNNNTYEIVKGKKFVSVNYEDWYPTAWGPIGVSYLVTKMVEVLNIFLNASNSKSNQTIKIVDDVGKWIPYNKEDLINPNKK